MELRQLKYFVKTANTLNFSEAARQLYITQSTLSQQIKQLEGELKCELFERDAHKVKLTEYGEKLLPMAKKCLQDADACVLEVANIKNLMIGTLNIGVTHSFSSILWHTMRDFLYTYKGVKLNVFYTNSEKLVTMLRRREIDFALAFRSNNIYDDILSYELFSDNLCAIVPKGHDLASRKKVTLKDLEPYPVALPANGVQGRHWIDEELKLNPDIKLRVRIELNDANFLLDLVSQGNRLVTILAGGATVYHKDLVAVPLSMEHTELSGCVHYLADNYRKHSATLFMDMLKNSPHVRFMQK